MLAMRETLKDMDWNDSEAKRRCERKGKAECDCRVDGYREPWYWKSERCEKCEANARCFEREMRAKGRESL